MEPLGMIIHALLLTGIDLSALLFGVYWGPWLAISRSMATFHSDVFLAIVARMDKNLGTIMGILMPVTLLSVAVVAVVELSVSTLGFWLSVASFLFFLVTALVTMLVEVPIVVRMRSWQADALPSDWQAQRDRWVSFHRVRVLGGFAALLLLVSVAVF